uniref:Reverse transcriptase domain-containing protein n=1 Tax=Tanacetum cinerariifolium TaxID=118510 RepID=A0A6L2JVN3_TANCI|nr:reverse transcriptase domain-containing protein [Tanacetum cinerariifolium]
MAKMFLGKYFPPSMGTKLRNEITNFRQRPDESLFEARECYKFSINHYPNQNMLPVTQIDTFCNGLTLRHRDTINVAAGGTFIKRRHEECYDLIENMTAHHNDWDTSAQRTTVGQTQNVYATGAYNQGGNSYQPQDKLYELARTPLNKHCSAVLLKKLAEKLGDPDKFLIPCDFLGMDECLALADLDASINLMPLFVWNKLSLLELSPTCMTLELADRLISRSVRVAEDVFVKLGAFHFLADFVVVDFDADPRVPLILRRSFLKTERDLIDVYEGDLTLRIGKEAVTFNLDQTLRYSANYDAMSVNRIDLIDVAYIDFLLEEADAFLAIDDEPSSPKIKDSYCDSEGDILILEEFLNDDPSSPPLLLKNSNPWVSTVHCVPKKGGFTVVENEENELIPTRLVTGWRVCIDYRKLNDATRKDHFPLPFMDQMLERLAGNEYYCFLDGFSGYFQIPIDPQDKEKTTFTYPYGMFTYRLMPFGLCNAPDTFQRNSFRTCLSHLDKMLKWCEDTNLYLNWEKIHFIVKEGIILGHNISKNGIEVDKAKVDAIAKLPHLTTFKDDKPRLLRWVLLLQEFDIIVRDKKGAENLATDHLSRLENPHQSVLDKKEMNETFPLETLNVVSFRGDSSTPWFADFAKFGTSRTIISDRGTHFCNDQFAKVMLKYGVTHCLAIAITLKLVGKWKSPIVV